MVSNISYIDDTRVAVWGWSYGGYLAAQLLAEDDRRLISCAVSVAPVVKWQLYGKFISSFFRFNLLKVCSKVKFKYFGKATEI